jgi:SAM-dependent methyltransferase
LEPPGAQVCREPYASPRLQRYLTDFYGPQGTPEPQVLVEHDYVLRACEACGLVYQEWIPSEWFARQLYERWIDPDAAKRLHDEARGPAFRAQLLREIAALIDHFSRPALEVLDFGMGWGEWCLMAKALGCNAYGYEPSEARVIHGRRNGIATLHLDEIGAGRFDVIHTDQVFEHVPAPLETVRQLAGALRPGGLLKLSVPDGRGIASMLASPDWSVRALNPVAPLEHVNCFTPRALRGLAAQGGLRPFEFSLRNRYAGILTSAQSGRARARALAAPLARHFLRERTNLWFEKPAA